MGSRDSPIDCDKLFQVQIYYKTWMLTFTNGKKTAFPVVHCGKAGNAYDFFRLSVMCRCWLTTRLTQMSLLGLFGKHDHLELVALLEQVLHEGCNLGGSHCVHDVGVAMILVEVVCAIES